MSVERLVLLRHGRTASNAERRWQGHLDVSLDDVGRVQAEATASWLGKALAEDAARGAVRLVCSDLSRARQTAEPLAAALGVTARPDAGLRERDVGAWEGLTHHDISVRFPAQYAAWRAGADPEIDGWEPMSEAGGRVERALRRHVEAEGAEGAQVIVAVGHGGSMRGAMLRLVGLTDGGPGDLRVLRRLAPFGNCHWAEVIWFGGSWQLKAYNLRAPD